MRRIVVPVAGDLVIDKLGLSEADRAMVVEETDCVINVAASVNFEEPLLDALEINYFGCKRMLQLAKECKRARVMTHVSTAFTNSDNHTGGTIEEKVYDINGVSDPEQIVKHIVRLGPQKCEEQLRSILGKFPNTYTFTKRLAELMLRE